MLKSWVEGQKQLRSLFQRTEDLLSETIFPFYFIF